METPTAVLWLQPEHTDIARALIVADIVSVIAAGSPDATNTATVASSLDVPPATDLRDTLNTHNPAVLLMLAADDFGSDPSGSDTSLLSTACKSGTKILSIEPLPASAVEYSSSGWKKLRDACPDTPMPLQVGRFQNGGAWKQSAEARQLFGELGAVAIEVSGPRIAGTAGARLADAIDIATAMLGEPESVTAAAIAPASPAGIRPLPGDSLRNIQGEITAHLRFAEGRSANIVVSDHAQQPMRRLSAFGPNGKLTLVEDATTSSMHWLQNENTPADESRFQRNPTSIAAATFIVEDLARLIKTSQPKLPITDPYLVLTIAQACLLSMRTGQSESPATVRRMLGV
ncbi:MAG: hypothetical protein AAF747_05955 [Planctomycetota bacterium]